MRIRHALLCALLVVARVQAQSAPAADWVGGFVLAEQEQSQLNATPLNTDNFMHIASRKTALAGLLEGSYQGISWRARLEAQHTPEQSGSRLIVQEFNRVFRLNEQSTLSLGKRLYALDPGYLNQPLGFFQKRLDLSDPLDTLGQSEGVPMAALSWSSARASMLALYSRDGENPPDGYNRGVEQALLKFGYEFDQLSAGLLLRRASGEAHGLGASFSAAWGESLSCYGAYYRALGSQRPILSSLLEGGTVSANEPGIGQYRSNDGQAYPRASLGLRWTPADLPQVQIEYAYDRRGLSGSQYAGLLQTIRRNQESALPVPVRQARLADLSQLLIATGARRHYLSLSLAHSLHAWDLNAGLYASLEDRSRVWHAGAEYKLSPALALLLAATRQSGTRDSERALSPIAGTLAARLRFTF